MTEPNNPAWRAKAASYRGVNNKSSEETVKQLVKLPDNLRADRVPKKSEAYETAILAILKAHTFEDDSAFSAVLLDDLLAALTDLMLTETYKNYARDVKLGIVCGRREVLQMIVSAESLAELQTFARKELEGTK
jgi:hypothetical protein